jgi:hypothetical protein
VGHSEACQAQYAQSRVGRRRDRAPHAPRQRPAPRRRPLQPTLRCHGVTAPVPAVPLRRRGEAEGRRGGRPRPTAAARSARIAWLRRARAYMPSALPLCTGPAGRAEPLRQSRPVPRAIAAPMAAMSGTHTRAGRACQAAPGRTVAAHAEASSDSERRWVRIMMPGRQLQGPSAGS